MSPDSDPGPEPRARTEFEGSDPRLSFFRQHRWLPLVLPMAVFLVAGLWEPASVPIAPAADPATESRDLPPTDAETADDTDRRPGPASEAMRYPMAYSLRVLATLAAILFVLPYYCTVSFAVTWWVLPAGLLGGGLWVGICRLGITERVFNQLGWSGWLELGARAGYNPWDSLGDAPILLIGFLLVRFCGLVLIVPLVEEFFLRGFLMRFFERADWWTLPLATVTWRGALIAPVYGVLSHPAEPLAAAVWFSLVTLIQARTRNLWDCVLAHAATNLVLGLYVLATHDWQWW